MSDDIFTREARDNPDSHNSEQDLPLDNGNLDKPFSHDAVTSSQYRQASRLPQGKVGHAANLLS
jgi:hypothetical protein